MICCNSNKKIIIEKYLGSIKQCQLFVGIKNFGLKALLDCLMIVQHYTKKNDLAYFLDKICDIRCLYLPMLAPTKEILDIYKNKKISWNEYEEKYIQLINERKITGHLKDIDPC